MVGMVTTASNLAGQKFGRLSVIERDGTEVDKAGKRSALWRCLCECGATAFVPTRRLASGNTKSCGCLASEAIRTNRKTHGASRSRGRRPATPEYGVWRSIRSRCLNQSSPAFPDYGGRGIVMCDRWREDYTAFLADMGTKPTPRHSIDRIDVNGNYEPGNCRWATSKEQMRNTRRTHFATFQGETLCLTDWAAKTGLTRECIKRRLHHGWPVELALTAPSDPRRAKRPRLAPIPRSAPVRP
jgi:hypothetical protein